MRLVYLSLAWVVGIFLGIRYGFQPDVWIFLLVASLFFALPFHRKKDLIWLAICLVLLSGGLFRTALLPTGDPLQAYRGFHEIKGVVASDPQVKARSTVLQIEVKEIKKEGKWQDISGTVQVYAPKYPSSLSELRDFPFYRYGDLLEIGGTLKSPSPSKGGENFDFAEYLARQGIYSLMYWPKSIKLLSSGEKFKPLELIHRLRESISESLERALPEPQGSLAKAMLLGKQDSIPSEIKDEFSRTGTSHLLAISGLHVSIVAGIALGVGILIFGRHRPFPFLLALALVWLYVLLSGMRPSALRAAIMGSLWLYASWIGRPRSAFTALALAAALMLAFNPRLLLQVGFQLSFVATAGLIFLAPLFYDWGEKILGKRERELSSALNFVLGSLAVTLGAFLTSLPLIAYYFHLLPLVSVPATFFTLPAIPGIIVMAAITGIAGIASPILALFPGWICWLFVTYVLKAVDVFSGAPFAAADVEFNAYMVYSYYGVLIAALWLQGNKRKLKKGIPTIKEKVPKVISNIPTKWIILPLLTVTVLLWAAVLTAPDSQLHVFALDVGHRWWS